MGKCDFTIDGMKLTDILNALNDRINTLEPRTSPVPTTPPNNAVRVLGRFGGIISSLPLGNEAIIYVHGTECRVPMAAIKFIDPDTHKVWVEGLDR